MRRNRNDSGHNSFGRRPLRGRPIGENKPITYHPQGLKGAQEDFRSRVQLLARSSDNRDLSAALFKSLFTSACKHDDNQLLHLLSQVRYEALKLHNEENGDKIKRKTPGILKHIRNRLRFRGAHRNIAKRDKFEEIAHWCMQIEKLYNVIRRMTHSQGYSRLHTTRNLEDYKRKLNVACSKIIVTIADVKIEAEKITPTSIIYRTPDKEIILNFAEGGGPEPPVDGYEFVVALIRDVKAARYPNKGWEVAKNFVEDVKNMPMDDIYRERSVEANNICQRMARDKVEKRKTRYKGDFEDVLDGIWSTCQKYASMKDWPKKKKPSKEGDEPTITPIPQGWS